jgi:beta-phosphoglucomutase
MAQNMSLRAVLFDLDGVIVDTARYHYIAWKQLADKLGIYFDEEINERLKGVSRMASLEIILERSSKTYTEEEKEALATEKNNQYVAMVEKITPADILPGVTGFLEELKDDGIQSAVCSASKSAGMIIDLLDLNDFFDAVLGGADVTKPKPDPEIFELARDRFGLTSDECLVVEDAFAGIEAAKIAGMKALGIGDASILTNADVVYRDMTCFNLDDAKKLFQNLCLKN